MQEGRQKQNEIGGGGDLFQGGAEGGLHWGTAPPPSVRLKPKLFPFFSDESFPKIIWLHSKHLLIRTAL